MTIKIINRTLEPIFTTIRGEHHVIKSNGKCECLNDSIEVGESIPQNLLDMEANGFIRIARD